MLWSCLHEERYTFFFTEIPILGNVIRANLQPQSLYVRGTVRILIYGANDVANIYHFGQKYEDCLELNMKTKRVVCCCPDWYGVTVLVSMIRNVLHVSFLVAKKPRRYGARWRLVYFLAKLAAS